MRVFVLLFNARTENEGIHTLRVGDRDIVLMFESEDDATRYALLLEAQDFLSPAIEAIEDEEIQEFCSSAGYEWKYIPEGFIPQDPTERLFIAPPETNVSETTWQLEAEKAPAEASDPDLDQIRRQLEGLFKRDE